MSTADYLFGGVLGEGAYAHVVLAQKKRGAGEGDDGAPAEQLAIKIMDKAFLEKEGKVKYAMMERDALLRCASCPFVLSLVYAFQDDEYIFLCLELAPGGDLEGLIRRARGAAGGGLALAPADAAFYVGEVALALRFLHGHGVAHRDLKPNNVLLDARGHVKLADFGTALDTRGDPERAGSFEGTAEYVSPEVLLGEPTTCACDLWALGCLCHEALVGAPPFAAPTQFMLMDAVLAAADDPAAHPRARPDGMSEAGADLVAALLVQPPSARLGAERDDDGDGGGGGGGGGASSHDHIVSSVSGSRCVQQHARERASTRPFDFVGYR